jgi:TonB family protein
VNISTPKHCEELDGVVKFAAMIDTAGLPHELKPLDASDRRLVGFATEIVEALHFKPATVDGSPSAVAIELTVGLHTCAQREQHPENGDFYQFTLRAHPLIAMTVVAPPTEQKTAAVAPAEIATVEHVGKRVSAPIPTVVTEPDIPVSRRFRKRGPCFLGVTIDANGVPQNIHVVRGLDPELDSNAMEAVKNWRFKPALSDGSVPVAVEGTVVATFEYIEKEPVAFAAFIPVTPEKVLAAKARQGQKRPVLEPVNADEVIARYMPPSRITGLCLVSLVIDTTGVPQNVHIVKGLDSSIDMETIAMVEHLRFKPARIDGATPGTVWTVIPVRYRVTVGRPTWRDIFFSLAEIPILLFI